MAGILSKFWYMVEWNAHEKYGLGVLLFTEIVLLMIIWYDRNYNLVILSETFDKRKALDELRSSCLWCQTNRLNVL